MNLPAIAGSLSSLATQYGAPLANHLWQSTAFAGLVWLLTLLLRKNRAQARYQLWLIASAKFLFPFSLLIGLGRQLAWPGTATAVQPRLFLAMETIGRPFSLPNPPPIPITAAPSMWQVALRDLPIFLVMVWVAGCVAVIVMWYLRWQRLNAARRAALPSKSGREFEALRRTEQSMRSSRQISLILSPSSLEPGILGVLRPVLLLPAGISGRLTDVQLDSVITHELCHVRRRDNLAAALHMLVEALFWFHPLVWWMGARLVEERERACDEEVLRLGADPHTYAESILKVCKFYLEPPLFCAAGVTGSNLKKRIEAIMMNRKTRSLDFSRKLLLSAVGLLAALAPIAFGFMKPAKSAAESEPQDALPPVPAFESAMIRPNNGEPMTGFTIVGKPFTAIMWKGDHLMATNFTLHGLIRVAYGVPDDQIIGGPDWLDKVGYDLDAKMEKSAVDEMQIRGQRYGVTVRALIVSGRRLMFQKLLSDRFKLSFHRETRDIPVYALTVAADGSKLQPAKPGDTYPNGLKKMDGSPEGANILVAPERGKLVGQGVPLASLVKDLSAEYYLHRTVLDKTGLTDKYDFTLQWTPEKSQEAILAAVQGQLGLKLEPQTAPVEVLVIDHAEQITGDESRLSQPQDPSLAESVTASMPPPLVYKAVSIKSDKSQATATFTWNFPPDGFNATNVTLASLIEWAYQIDGFQIAGAPDWVNTERYDVQAQVDNSVADELRDLSEKQRGAKQQPMLLELLADHFKLETHRESRYLPVYELVVVGSSPKLQHAKSGESPLIRFGKGLITGQAVPIGPTSNDRSSLVRMLSSFLQRPVLDKTGLAGRYDFSLEWTPGDSQGADGGGPSIFAAVQEQLGLKLLQSNHQTAPVQVLVIDHAERVTGNELADAARLN